MSRRPKVFLRHSTTRVWQQIEDVSFVQHIDQNVLLHFTNHWRNRNVIQQFRRSVETGWSRGGKLLRIVEYPAKGESRTITLSVRVTVVREKNGLTEVAAIVGAVAGAEEKTKREA